MKVLVDMNLSPRWADWFKQSGLEAVHWIDVGQASAADSDIMAFAAQRDFVVLTHDLDFSAILAASHGNKPSVIQLRADDLSPDAIGARVLLAINQLEALLLSGALVSVEPHRTRVRVLPLNPPQP